MCSCEGHIGYYCQSLSRGVRKGNSRSLKVGDKFSWCFLRSRHLGPRGWFDRRVSANGRPLSIIPLRYLVYMTPSTLCRPKTCQRRGYMSGPVEAATSTLRRSSAQRKSASLSRRGTSVNHCVWMHAHMRLRVPSLRSKVCVTR